MKRVVITGIGAISCIGNNVEENHRSLIAGHGGLELPRYFKSKYAQTNCFGEVKMSNAELASSIGIADITGITRTDLLAHKAFAEAIADASLSNAELISPETALISASTVGGMCNTDQLYFDATSSEEASEYATSYAGSAHVFYLAKQYSLNGITDALNTACSSSANALIVGTRLIRAGRAKRVIVGGVDSLAKYTVNGFNALGILSQNPTKPFDRDRCGLTLGEAAAYLVLEALDDVQGKDIYAEVSGYGNSSDAFHTSSISDNAEGIVLAIEQAIRMGHLAPSQIDYVNAHGTGTGNNDFAEMVGFKRIFEKTPPFNSTKSYTGHTLSASGALEAVYTILSITNSELYPSLNFEHPIDEFNISPITAYQPNVNIDHALSNSYGFSGSCTSLLLSKF